MQEDIIKLMIEALNKKKKSRDIPVMAVISCNQKIIAKSVNTREKHKNVLGHAEINAIIKASKKLKRWNLNDCEIYVTLKPCSMCYEVIKQSRIDTVYYLLDKPLIKKEYTKTKFNKIFVGDMADFESKCEQLIAKGKCEINSIISKNYIRFIWFMNTSMQM